MFIYVFVALVERKLLTSILHMYLRCFTVYNVHNLGTKGSQSRERHMSAIGVYIANVYLNTYKFECDLHFCYECGRSQFQT